MQQNRMRNIRRWMRPVTAFALCASLLPWSGFTTNIRAAEESVEAATIPTSNLLLHLDAADIETSNGSAVSTWTSKVNSYTASQSNTDNQPKLVTYDGYDALYFDGNDSLDVSDFTNLNGKTGVTIVAVSRAGQANMGVNDAGFANQNSLLMINESGGYGGIFVGAYQESVKARFGIGTGENFSSYVIQTDLASPQTELSSTIFMKDGVSQSIYINGECVAASNNGRDKIYNTDITKLQIGTGISQGFVGDIAELLIFDRALSTEELGQMHSYLQNRYFADAMTQVSLDQTAMSLDIGVSKTLTATVEAPEGVDKTVIWSSSDPAVAEVDNGVVTAKSAGIVTITAQVGKKSATCTVTVYSGAEAQSTYYVAPDGSDTNDGSKDYPFATLEKARDTIRLLKDRPEGGITVYLRGGTYYRDEAFVLTELDSGTADQPITYAAYPGEKPVLVGGVKISGWTDDDKDGTYTATISENKTGSYAMYDDGVRMTIARETAWQNIAVADQTRLQAVYGSPTAWFGEVLHISNLNGDQFTVDFGSTASSTGGLQYLQGAKEYINEAGEWAIEGTTLYYKPVDGTDPADSEIVLGLADRMFYLHGSSGEKPVQYVNIEGLELGRNNFGTNLVANGGRGEQVFESPYNLHGLVDLDNAQYISVKDCHFDQAGYVGVVLQHTSQNNTISGNHIEGSGYAGIFLYGGDPGVTEYINHHNTITNNLIHDCGQFVGHGSGIYLINSGDNEITHNHIHSMPRYGISLKGQRWGTFGTSNVNWGYGVSFEDHFAYNMTTRNYIAYNMIHDTGMRSADGGGVEGWGAGRDNVIENNIIYNAYRGVATGGWRGHSVFLDDGVHYTTVRNNISYDTGGVSADDGVMLKGVGNVVENNVFDVSYEVRGAAHVGPFLCPASNQTFSNNVVYANAVGSLNGDGTLNPGGNGDRTIINFEDGNGKSAYASIAQMNQNLYYNTQGGMYVKFNGAQLTLEQWQKHESNTNGFDSKSIAADPMFVDAANRDYRLEAESPAYALGVESIDTASIGLTEDYKFADPEDQAKTLFLVKGEKDGSRSATVNQGETLELSVILRTANGYRIDSPQGTTWESTDPAVAAVVDGVVTAVSGGSTTITAKNGNLQDVFVIHVENRPQTEYTVTFETNGGSAVAPQTVTAGAAVSKPDAPAKDGYAFAGWYSDAQFEKEYDFSTQINGDITLYAKWIANCDLNGDGNINLLDIVAAMEFYGTRAGDSDWEEAQMADVNGDDEITIEDLIAIVLQFD